MIGNGALSKEGRRFLFAPRLVATAKFVDSGGVENMLGIRTATTLAMALSMAGVLRTALGADAPTTDKVTIETDTVRGARVLSGPAKNTYPDGQILDNREGWVVLSMMIGTDGKPYEVMVADSSGNPAFEKAAFKTLDQMTFEPAQRAGTPIESSLRFKLKFAIKDLAKGATPQFVSAYKRFGKAIESKDKAAADAQLAKLQPRNLYEEAFANIGRYMYDVTWGSADQQYRDLRRAIAGERKPVYLPKETFTNALFARFKLEIQFQDFGSALDTWEVLEPLATPEIRNAAQGTVEQIHTLITSPQPIQLAGKIGERSWTTQLLRYRFSFRLESGSISTLKLRCAGKFIAFKYEPELEYSIGNAKDRCGLEVIGEPGTTFVFMQ